MQCESPKPALLVLEDGSSFQGYSFSFEGYFTGEVIFNTSITGYQEIITDPSYANQIVVLTSTHIGNTGTNHEDWESTNCWLTGLVVKELSKTGHSWRSNETFPSFLKKNKIPCIYGIDTRKLTILIRETGSQNGCIAVGNYSLEISLTLARHPETMGIDLISKVTTKQPYVWNKKSCKLRQFHTKKNNKPPHVYVYDFGVKHSILRRLMDFECYIKVVPALFSYKEVLRNNVDGIVLSNGPGNPASAHDIINNVKQLLKTQIPILGICLGCQFLGLAAGGRTVKMKFGHHGTNHPVYDLRLKKVLISSQNHGFCIEESSLPSSLSVTHRSLFDDSIEGIKHKNVPAIGFQGHPEANPGPMDLNSIFSEFMELIHQRKNK